MDNLERVEWEFSGGGVGARFTIEGVECAHASSFPKSASDPAAVAVESVRSAVAERFGVDIGYPE